MPKLTLTTKEAASLAAKRKRDKAFNAAMMVAVEAVKKRMKGSANDALQAATLNLVLTDLRKLLR